MQASNIKYPPIRFARVVPYGVSLAVTLLVAGTLYGLALDGVVLNCPSISSGTTLSLGGSDQMGLVGVGGVVAASSPNFQMSLASLARCRQQRPCGFGDFDCNGSRDLADYAALQQCYSAPASARCLNVFDAAVRNGLIELDDYAAFLSTMNAP